MDWENERYVRVYTRETVDDAILSWEATALWDAIMKRFDRAGVIDMGRHGWRGIAVLVRMPVAVVERVYPELLEDGRIQIGVDGTQLCAPNYIPAQEAKSSDKQRQSESRARRSDKARADVTFCDKGSQASSESDVLSANSSSYSNGEKSANTEQCHKTGHDVTKRDTSERNPVTSVTARHTPSHPVTPSLAKPSLANILSSSEPETVPRKKTSKTKTKPGPRLVAPQALVFARSLADAIASRQPGSRPAREPQKCAESWANDIDKLHRLDKRPWTTIGKVLNWSQRDVFWQQNIMSGSTLRKKFDQLESKMGNSQADETGHYRHTGDEEYAGRIIDEF